MAMSADNGFAQAQLLIGQWLNTGLAAENVPVTRDPVRALKYLEMAHKQGNAESAFLMSGMWAEGRGTPQGRKDPKKAHELMMDAAVKGLAVAQHNAGAALLEGSPHVQRDSRTAFEFWLMAAESGFPLSQINVARAYMTGLRIDGPGGTTIDKDWALARSFLDRAAAEGDKQVQGTQDSAKAVLKQLDELEAANPDEAKEYQKRAAGREKKLDMPSCSVM
ncbi:hypothetical protein BC831DRAFT_205320 [Entophlyctis helioformis]|nr:hypothetical protein BC831DRAFT_205320 [Entophlyctis helioformis]